MVLTGRATTEPSHRHDRTHVSTGARVCLKQSGQSWLQWGRVRLDPAGLRPPKLLTPKNFCSVFL